MKSKLKFGIIFLLIVFSFGCQNDEMDNETLIGSWKQIESSISSGGPQYIIEIENGEELMFFTNGRFTSNRISDCSTGNYFNNSDELFLYYDCSKYEKVQTYQITFESDFLILVPTSVICIEGCSYKYKRL